MYDREMAREAANSDLTEADRLYRSAVQCAEVSCGDVNDDLIGSVNTEWEAFAAMKVLEAAETQVTDAIDRLRDLAAEHGWKGV